MTGHLPYDPTRKSPETLGKDLFGTDQIKGTFELLDLRRGRCYELAAYAITLGNTPAGALLVHGTIDGGGGPLGHAWLRLPDGTIWEPILGDLYEPAEWDRWACPTTETEYTMQQVRAMTVTFEHWGPWPTDTPEGNAAERSEPGAGVDR